MPKRVNGEGTIWQRANGLWCGELTLGYDENGKREKLAFSSMDIDKLQKLMNDAKYKLNRNVTIAKSDYTVAEWVKFWLETYKTHSIKSNTYDNYEYALDNYIKNSAIGGMALDKVKPPIVQKLYNDMIAGKLSVKPLSTSTVKKVHVTLNQAFNQAVTEGLVYSNPCNATKVPKIKKRKALAMTKDQQSAFEEQCQSSEHGDLFMLALQTGMRIGELAALTWNDVDLAVGEINIANTASSIKNRDKNAATKYKTVVDAAKTDDSVRSMPLNKSALAILRNRQTKPQNKVFVFSSGNGTILMKRNLERSFRAIADKAQLSRAITTHTLRHTFASREIEAGVDAKTVCELMGHSSIQVTYDVYGHIFPHQKKQAVEKLEKIEGKKKYKVKVYLNKNKPEKKGKDMED